VEGASRSDAGATLEPLAREARTAIAGCDPSLKDAAESAVRAIDHGQSWLVRTFEGGPQAVEAGARRLALTLGRALEVALLVREATRAKKHGDAAKPAAAARRLARHGIDLIADESLEADATALLA
jgi:hypothetical protein